MEKPRRISKDTQATIAKIRAEAYKQPEPLPHTESFTPAKWIDIDAVTEEHRPATRQRKVSFARTKPRKISEPQVLTSSERLPLSKGEWYRPEPPIDTSRDVSGSMTNEFGPRLRNGSLLSVPRPGDVDFKPETVKEFILNGKALFGSTQTSPSGEKGRATIAGMEGLPKTKKKEALAAPDVDHLSPEETRDAYLDYYDNRDAAPPAPTAVNPSLEGVDPLEYYNYAKPAAEQAPSAPATADVVLSDENRSIIEAAMAQNAGEQAPAAAAVENPLTDTTPVVGEDIPHLAQAQLTERSTELDEAAAALGEREASWIRNLGERYNKLDWKWKLALGAALGGAAAAGMAFGSPLALIAGATGVATQRVAAGLGIFVKAENYLQNKATKNETDEATWKRQLKAASMAVAYAGLTTFGIKKAIDYTADWFGHMWGDHTPSIPHSQPVGELTDKLPTAPEAPGLTVEATKGKGYEYMAKRLYESMHTPNAAIDQDFIAAHPESDAAQLWHASDKDIDGVVHRLAAKHAFYQADADNVLIQKDTVMGFTPDGELRVGLPKGSEFVNAAPEAPVTPPYHPAETVSDTAPSTGGYEGEHTAILNTDGTISGSNGQVDLMNAPYNPPQEQRGFFATMRRIFRGAPDRAPAPLDPFTPTNQ